MKKFLTAMATVLAVVVMAFTLAACSDASGSIKKAFEKEGYTVTAIKAEDSKALMSLLDDEQKKDASKYEVFTCTKSLQSATVVKFPSKNDIIDVIGQDAYDKAVDGGLINKNCYLLVPLGVDVINIFKNA
ncbi:MAG: hypothetical protein K2O44_03780 [Clostridia bacterium]|nr:hypothetical protein [Clostridia bacterium]